MKGKTDYLFSADLSLSAQTVMDLIDQIGEVTVGSRAAIDRAIETYETLPAYVKGQVTNADKLSDAKAAYVAAVIDSIGAITPESGAAISDARNFYDTKLTAQEQEKVGNYDTLVTAEAVYNVVKQIADIGEVTTDSYWDIYYAKQAYNKLSETQKALVTNYEDISKAEVAYVVALIDSLSTLDPINSQSKINSAKTRYNALSEEQKQQVYNYGDISKAEIARVEALIRRIGEVTIQSKNYITQAKTAFNALTAEQQALVSNAADISQAEIAYVEARIADIGEVTVDSSSKISLARNEYNALEETQQQKVGNSNTLIEAEVDYVEALIDHIGEVTVSSKGDITRAITAYDALTETQQALVSNAADISKAQIAYVEALIAAIGTVSVDSEAQILEAKAEYQALTEAQQGQVGNYDEVIQAQVDYVIACIDSLDQFGASSKAQLAIDKAKTDYAALTEAQQALVSNYEKIAQAEDQLPEVLAQVVSIAGAEEFAAFAARVNDGEDLLNGCLTADIDLSETVWIPIGNTADTAYAGTFDGNGYAVSGFHFTSTASYQGLFGRINTGGVVKNLTVASGEIKANHGNFGVIAGQNKGRIENCANYANITYTSAYNGGIAGQNGGEIARCFNAGSLSTTGTPSANGGIAGSNNSKCTIIDCYNVGNINGGQWEMYNGGVVGFANGPVINCYNTGTVKGYQCAQIASSGSAGMLQNCVGLDGNGKLTGDFQTSDEAQAKLVTAQELKELAAAMGDAFTSDEAINDGYPILRWQVAEKDVLVLIDAIGEVTLSSSEEIKAARTAYDALPAAFQAKVTNYSTLCDAESTYSALVAAEELATAKNTAKSQLDTYKDASNYRDEQKAELTAAIEAGKRKIDEAADLEGVSIALANAKAVMDGIKTDAQLSEEAAAALAKAKEDAKTELEGYKNAEAYRPEQQTELESAIAAGKQAIDEAADLESVSKALTDAKSAMDGIKTDAQLTEEETAAALASAKDDAKTELEGYKNAEAYRPEQQTELESAIAAGKQAIDEAADLESVSKALTDAKAVLDGVKTDAQLRQDDISQLNDLIEAIGEVNEMNSAEALVKIEAAERALAALKAQYGDAVLEEVDNIDKLLEARQKYDELNPVVRLGDINGDGKIDAVDALLALQHSVQLSVLEGDKLTAADVNRDGRVDASDALLMLQHSVGLITEFPNAQ